MNEMKHAKIKLAKLCGHTGENRKIRILCKSYNFDDFCLQFM